MKQPDDPGPEEDPSRDYYDRKMRHREEMLPGLVWMFIVGLVIIAGLLIWNFAFGQDPPVPLEEPCPSGNCTVYNQAHLYAFTGDERMIRWSLVQNDVDTMALFTELQVFEFPPKGSAFPVMRAELPEVERSFGWTPTRAGTYFIEARACRTDGDLAIEPDVEPHATHGLILCSIIASSTDPAHTDPGVYPRGFVMLIKIPAATGGGIE